LRIHRHLMAPPSHNAHHRERKWGMAMSALGPILLKKSLFLADERNFFGTAMDNEATTDTVVPAAPDSVTTSAATSS
jgi:hypothetical protein